MSKKEKNIPKELENLKPFKEMKFSEKMQYIWDYYKFPIFAVFFSVLFVVSLIYSIRRNSYETLCYIAAVDGKLTGCYDNKDKFSTEFTEYLGIDGKSERIDIDYNYSLTVNMLDNEGAVSQQKLYTLSSTASLDGYLAGIDLITYFSSDVEPFLVELTEILTEDELEQIGEENIVYYTKKNGTKLPIAVRLTNTKVVQESDFTMKDPCYGVVVSSPHKDTASDFIRYAFGLSRK